MFLKGNKVDIYLQIKEHYQKLIELEVLKKGDELPSLRKVAFDLGINPSTVEKAYHLLEEEGFIEIFPKKGAYVKRDIPEVSGAKLEQLKIVLIELRTYYEKEDLIKKIKMILEDEND